MARPKGVAVLTEMETEVLNAFLTCSTNVEAAEKLCLTSSTVAFHLRSIYRKIGVERLHSALLWGLREGVIRLDANFA